MSDELKSYLEILAPVFVGAALGIAIGYCIGVRKVERSAIRAGVGHYIIANTNSPLGEFEWRKP